MRVCLKCGTENSDTERFCKQCASPLQQSGGRTCPSGRHTMDPTWTECAYCKQENVLPVAAQAPPVRHATVVENRTPPRPVVNRPLTYKEDTPLPPRPPRPINVAPGHQPPLPPPGTPSGPPPRQRSQTEFRPIFNPTSDPAQPIQQKPAVASERKIVGILVSYSWKPEGQIYPIREGRNYIGRDNECEVTVPEDTTMSGRNSHITFRQNFVVGDLVSMTGTDLDGMPIEEQFHSLQNYSTIRAGSTYFTFMVIKPPTAPDAGAL